MMKLSADETVSSSASVLPFEAVAASSLEQWPAGTVFLAAVSGGADSTAMLAALAAVERKEKREKKEKKLHCLHIDHGIRSLEETRGDAQAVRDLCKTLHIPCRIISIPAGKIAETARASGLGIEGTARIFRHRALNREARRIGAARILVAHTRDDLLETVLMRLLRGSGPAGLAAMPRERGQVLRPLLTLNRSDVIAYLKTRGIPFRTDSTNEDIHYLRNRIRHKLVPCLDDFFPYWRKTVFAMAETQRLTAEFLSAEAQRQVLWEEREDREGMSLRTSEASFFSQPPLIREEALFQAADRLGAAGKGPPRRKTIRLFTKDPDAVEKGEKVSALDAGPIRIEKQGADITVASVEKAEKTRKIGKTDWYDEGCALLIKEPGIYTLKGLQIVCRFPGPGETEKKQEKEEKKFFFAYLPLVLRQSYQNSKGFDRMGYSGYTDIITAEDMKGPAACIFSHKKDTVILLCREEPRTGEDGRIFFAIVSGGIDV